MPISAVQNKVSKSISLVKLATELGLSGNLARLSKWPIHKFMQRIGFKTQSDNPTTVKLNVPYKQLYLNLVSGAKDGGKAARAQFQRVQRNRARTAGLKYNENIYYPIVYEKALGQSTGTKQKIFTGMPITSIPQNIGYNIRATNPNIDKVDGISISQPNVRDKINRTNNKETFSNLFGLLQTKAPKTYGRVSLTPTSVLHQLFHLLTPGVTAEWVQPGDPIKQSSQKYNDRLQQMANHFGQFKAIAANMGQDIKSMPQLINFALSKGFLKRRPDGTYEQAGKTLNKYHDIFPQAGWDRGWQHLVRRLNTIQQLQYKKNKTADQQKKLNNYLKWHDFMIQHANNNRQNSDTRVV